MSLLSWFRQVVSRASGKKARRENRPLRSRWRSYQPWVEGLENRLAPTVNVTGTADRLLTYSGTANDSVNITALTANTFSITPNGGTTLQLNGSNTAMITTGAVNSITVTGSMAAGEAVTFDTAAQSVALTGLIAITDIETVMLTGTTGTLQAASFSESGGTNAATTFGSPLTTTGAAGISVTGDDAIAINSVLTTMAGGGDPLTLTANAQTTSAITWGMSGSISADDGATLTSNAADTLGPISAGSLNVTAGGISQASATTLTVTGASSFNGGAHAITLAMANSFGGAVTLNNSGTNDVSITNSMALSLATSSIGRNLTVNASGAIGQTGALTVGGASSFSAASNPITLMNAANAFTGAVSVNNSGMNDVSLTGSGALSLAASTVGRNLTVNATGAISQTGILTVGGTSSFSTGSFPITLGSNNAFTGAVAVNNGGTNDVMLMNGGALALAASNVGRNLTVTAGGAISQTGILTVAGTSSFSAGANPITLMLGNAFTGAVALNNSGANDVSLTDTLPLVMAASSVGRNLSLTSGGAITQTGALIVPGSLMLTVTAANSDILLSSAANDITGAVTFAGTLSNIRDVSLRNTDIAAAPPTNLASLPNLRNLTLTFDNAAISLPALTLTSGGNLIVSAGGTIMQTGALVVPGFSSFTTTTNDQAVTLINPGNAFTGPVSFVTQTAGTNNGNVQINNGTTNLSLGTSTIAGSLSATTGGTIGQSGALTVAGTSSFVTNANDKTILLNNSGNALTGAVSFTTQTAGGNTGNVTINNGTTNLMLAASTIAGSLSATTGGTISQSGALTVAGTSSFVTNANDKTITLGNPGNALTGAVSFTTQTAGGNTGNVTINNGTTNLVLAASTIAGSLSATTGGTISQSGALTVAGTSNFVTNANDKTITLSNPGNALTGAVSFTTQTAGGNTGNVTINNGTTNLVLAASTIAGSLSATTGGTISQSGALTVAGTSSFVTNVNDKAITLNNPGNALTGAVSFTSQTGGGKLGGVTINNGTTNLVLAASTIAGSLSATTGGTISQSGALTVAGTSSFVTNVNDKTITLNDPGNALTGAVSFMTQTVGTNAGNVTINNGTTNLVLAASTIAGSLSATTGGTISQSGALTVAGTSSFATNVNDKTITLSNPGNALTGAVSFTTQTAGGNAGNVTINNGATNLVLGASTIAGSLSATTGGTISQTGPLTVAGTSSFVTNANDKTITLNNPGNALTGAVSFTTQTAGTNAGNVTINNGTTNLVLAASTIAGSLSATTGGTIGQSGALTVAGTSSFVTNVNDKTITLNNPGNALTGAVSFTTQTAGGNTGNVTINNGTTNLVLGTSTIAGTLSATTGGTINQSGPLTVAGTSSFVTNVNDKAITLNNPGNALTGAVSFMTQTAGTNAGNVTVNNGTTNLVLAASTIAGSLSATTGGTISQSGALTVAGPSNFVTNVNDKTITLNNPANAFTGAVSFTTQTVGTNAGNVTINNGTTNLILGGSTIAGSLTATTGGTISQSGALTVAGTSSFVTNVNDKTITLNNTSNAFTGAVSFTTQTGGPNAGNVTINNGTTKLVLGASTIAGFLNATTASAISVAGAVNAGGNPINLTAGTNISQTTAGVLTAGVLTTVSATGTDLSTATPANAVGSFNANNSGAGVVALKDAVATLQVTGILDTTAGGPVTINNTTGAISLTGAISAGANAVNLTASTGIGQNLAGTISGGLLTTVSGTGGTTLNSPNTVTSFHATDNSSTGISLTNTASPLTITGISETGTGPIAITNTGGITTTGTISSTSGNITLLNLNSGDIAITAPITVTTAASTGSVFLKNTAPASPTEVRLNIGAPITAATTAPASVTTFVNGITQIAATLTASATGNPLTTTNINLYGGASGNSTSTDPSVQPDPNSIDTFNVVLTGPNDGTSFHTLNLNGRGGSDSYTLFLQDQTAGPAVFHPVNINDTGTGASDSDVATITGSNHDSNDAVIITQSTVAVQVSGTPVNQLLNYQGLDNLIYNTATQSAFGVIGTGNGSDVIGIQSTLSKTAQPAVSPNGTPVTISGLVNGAVAGAGTDTVSVSNAHLLNQIQATVTFNAGKSGANSLFVDESANPAADSVVVTNSQISSPPPLLTFAPINYTGKFSLVSLNTGLVNNASTFDVNVQSTSNQVSSTKVATGPSNDFVLVSGSDQTLSHLSGALAIDEGAGSNKVVFSDAAFAGSDLLTLTSASLQGAGSRFVPISYTATTGSFGHDVVLFSGSVEGVNVQSDRADSTTFVSTGNGGNSITVSSNAAANGVLAGIAGTLVLQNGSGQNALFISDSGNAAATPGTNFTSNSVQVAGLGPILFGTTGSYNVVELELGQGNDIVSVQSTLAAAKQTVLVTGAGSDLVVVCSNGNTNGTLNGIQGALVIDEGAGANELVVSDAASSASDLIVLTSSLIFSNTLRFAQIAYSASGGSFADGVVLYSGSVETVNVQSDLAGAPTFVSTGNGGNTVIVSSNGFATGTVAGIVSQLVVQTGSGVNSLIVSDSGNPGASGGTTLNSNNIVINGQAPILYGTSGIYSSVALELGQGSDLVNVQSTLAAAQHTIVLTGAADDIISVSSTPNGTNGVLTGIRGELNISAGGGTNNQLIVSEAGYTANDTVTFTSNSIISNLGTFAPILYVGTFMPANSPPAVMADAAGNFSPNPAVGPAPGILLRMGQGNDTFTLSSMSLSSSVYADMGPGNDFVTVDVSNTSNYKGLTIDGGNVAAGSPFSTGLNQIQVVDVSGGGTATISSANGMGGGSKLHPFSPSNLGLVIVSYGNGSTSVIAVADFTSIIP
jgi:hypothetical protein